MALQADQLYSAFASRDRRFDGVFFIGVKSTGIYCRPVCPAKTPIQRNCTFFATAQAAESKLFRPCLRCRPELAPGSAPIDDAKRISQRIIHRIEDGAFEAATNLEEVAHHFDLSPRQVRRIVKQELGLPLVALIQSRRLLLAKQLLTETSLTVTQIAFASGFASLRRFNHAFLSGYKMAPTRLRLRVKQAKLPDTPSLNSRILMSYRPPYDWRGILEFLKLRMLKGVEWVDADAYSRTVQIGVHRGWIRVTHQPKDHALTLEFTHTLLPVLPSLLTKLKDLFDLAARPDLIQKDLGQDQAFRTVFAKEPGLRVPGAFDGFELAVRAVLGQQVTVKAATTLACRYVEAFGCDLITPFKELTKLTPSAERISSVSIEEIAHLGIVSARARCIITLAQEMASGTLRLAGGHDPFKIIDQLVKLPGIGQWTAHYIAMRALRWPDAFPKEDIVIRNVLGGVSAKQAEERSLKWQPWRSYAVLHLWRHSLTSLRSTKCARA